MEQNESSKSNQNKSSKYTKADFEKTKDNIKNKKKRKKWLIIPGILIGIFILLIIVGNINSCQNNQKKIKDHEKKISETLEWPLEGIATLLPKPDSTNGHITRSNNDSFYCTVYKINKNDYNDYIQKCKEKSFNVEIDLSSSSFKAKDNSQNELSISFHEAYGDQDESYNEMTISLDSKAYNDRIDANNKAYNEKQNQSQNNTSNSGNSTSVSADLKSFLDSYEQFVDKYVDFMKKYKDSGFSPSMLKDYTDLMNQLADFNSKISTWDAKKGSMSAQDLAYYTEVIARCTQKLAAVQ